MLSQQVIEYLNNDDSVSARTLTNNILNAKMTELLADKYDEISPTVFGEAKKASKTDKTNDSEDDSGDTLDPVGHGDSDIDNDGDSDETDDYLKNRRKVVKKSIKKKVDEAVTTTLKFTKDADGAAAIGSETSPKGLLASGKKVKKGEYKLTFNNDKQMMKFMDKYDSKISEAVSTTSEAKKQGGEETYGVRKQTFQTAKPDEKSKIKQKHYRDKENETRDTEAKRKKTERDKERKKKESGIGRSTER